MKTLTIVYFLLASVSFGQSSIQINRNVNRISNCYLKLNDNHSNYLIKHQLIVQDTSLDHNENALIKRLESFFPLIEFSIKPTPDVRELVRSSISGEERSVTISVSLVQTKMIGIEAKALILAHQIAHHYGGDHPNRLEWNSSESEAQINTIARILPKMYSYGELLSMMTNGGKQLRNVISFAELGSLWKKEHVETGKNLTIALTKLQENDTAKSELDCSFIPPGLDKSHSHFKEFALDTTFSTPDVDGMIGKFKAIYPDIEFHILWDASAVNAQAYELNGVKHVDLFGGMITHPYLGIEALSIVMAHEIGHHEGGEPTYDGNLSCEGQADYWAVTQCIHRVFSPDEVEDIINKGSDQLEMLFTNGLKKNLYKINIEKFDKKSYQSNSSCGHPPADCRIETYKQGLNPNPVKPSCAG